jgi:hypothetical protein
LQKAFDRKEESLFSSEYLFEDFYLYPLDIEKELCIMHPKFLLLFHLLVAKMQRAVMAQYENLLKTDFVSVW